MSFGSFESLKTSDHPFEIKIQFSKTIFVIFISFKNVFEKLKFIFVKVKGLER